VGDQPRREREVVEALAHGVRGGLTQRALREHDVRVGEEQPLAGRALGASPQRVVLAEPPRRQLVDAKHQQSLVPRGEVSEDGARRVARAIVDGDDLEARIVLREQRSDGVPDGRAFVARGNDHRKGRQRRRSR